MSDDEILMVAVPLKDKQEEQQQPQLVNPTWIATYKRRMARAVRVVETYAQDQNGEWNTLECDDVLLSERVQLRECMGGTTVVADAIVRGRAERYAYAARDFDPLTRAQWDINNGFVSCAQRESYHVDDGYTMHFVEQQTAALVPRARDRFLQGVLMHYYMSATHTHYVVFGDAGHPTFYAPASTVHIDGRGVITWGVVVRQLEERHSGQPECRLTLIQQCVGGGWTDLIGGTSLVAALYTTRIKEQLRTRITLLEDAVRNWKAIYGTK